MYLLAYVHLQFVSYLSIPPCCSYRQNGGVIWSKSSISIEGGTFIENDSQENGGVLFASEESEFILTGGVFENNTSKGGGVAVVDEAASLRVEGGLYSGNEAASQGGAFAVFVGGEIQVQ